jgi:hypothetical protein
LRGLVFDDIHLPGAMGDVFPYPFIHLIAEYGGAYTRASLFARSVARESSCRVYPVLEIITVVAEYPISGVLGSICSSSPSF